MRTYIAVLMLVGVVLLSGCLGDSGTTDTKEKKDTGETGDTFVMKSMAAEMTDGSSGSIVIPFVGAAVVETDIKHHWDMPGNISKVVINLTVDKSGWDLELSTGTGECPDSGEQLASTTGSEENIVLEYEAPNNGTLAEGQWFAHIRVNDATSHRGETLNYELSVELYYWEKA